ncbi:MAG: hypothetical protein ACKO4A_12725 [Gammaproteobacteria bacterium]
MDDARAGACLRQNTALLRSAFGARFDAIEAAVASFAFDVALSALAAARAAMDAGDRPG